MRVSAGQARKWILLCARIFVVVLIYSFIFSRVPLSTLTPLVAPGLMIAFTLSVVLNIGQAVLCTLRWRLLAAKNPCVPSFMASFAAYMEGLFFNQALPSFIGGDAVRILRWQAYKVKASDAFLSVFRDRLFGAIGAASFTVLACALLWNQPMERYKILTMLTLGGGVTIACIAAVSLSQRPQLSRILSRAPGGIRSLSKILEGRSLGPRIIWNSLGITVIAQLLPGISVYVLALALEIDLSFAIAVSITGAILLVSMIPVSLAGWGVREFGFLIILEPLGVANEKALMLGISLGLAGLCGALLGGISILMNLSSPAKSSPTEMNKETVVNDSTDQLDPLVR